MLPPSALQSINVPFATPCYISAVTMNYTTSMFSLAPDSAQAGLNCTLHMHSESLITRGRNNTPVTGPPLAQTRWAQSSRYAMSANTSR